MQNVGLLLVSIAFMALYVLEVRKVQFQAKTIVIVGLCGALCMILNMVKLFHLPQGGSISLVCMLPIMIAGALYGNGVGMTAGLVAGLLGIIDGATVIHPAQFMLDYIMPYMCFGLSGIFRLEGRVWMILGAIFASILSVGCNIISGMVYFGSYAPEGMSPLIYSLVYNLSTNGVECLIAILILMIFPLKRLKTML